MSSFAAAISFPEQKLDKLGALLVGLCIVALHYPNVVFSLLTIACFIVACCHPAVISCWRKLGNTQLALAIGMFLLWLLVSGLIAHTYGYAAFALGKRYAKLAWLLVIPVLLIDPRARKWCWHVFIGCTVATALIAWVQLVGLISWPHPIAQGLFRNHIFTSIQLALALFISVQFAYVERTRRWPYVVVAVILALHLFFVNTGRVGMLVALVLLPMACLQMLSKKWRLASLLLFPLLVASLYLVAPSYHQRAALMVQEMHQAVQKNDYDSSVCTRMAFLRLGIKDIMRSPIVGHGLGSFRTLWHQDHPDEKATLPYDHPHNEFILLSYEQGIVGLGLFLFCLIALWRLGGAVSLLERNVLQGSIVACLVAGMTEPVIMRQPTGFTFILIWSIILGGYLHKQQASADA